MILTDQARIGRTIRTGEYPLTPRELAALLVLASTTPRNPSDNDLASLLIDRCWNELTSINHDLVLEALNTRERIHTSWLLRISEHRITNRKDAKK